MKIKVKILYCKIIYIKTKMDIILKFDSKLINHRLINHVLKFEVHWLNIYIEEWNLPDDVAVAVAACTTCAAA